MESVNIDEMLDNPDLAKYLIAFTSGQIIFLEGDDSQDLYLLVSGEVEIFKGNKKIREISARGSIFGELSFFLGDRRTASVKAKNNVEVIRLPREKIKPFLNAFPNAGREIMRYLAQWLSETSQILYGLKELCDQMPEALIVTDKNGRILVWNSAAERLFGRNWAHMRQTDLAEIYENPQEYRDFLQKAQVQYAQRENVFSIQHPQKGRRAISTSFTVLYDGHHNFQGVLSLSRDVTGVKKLEKKYRQTFFWLIASSIVSGLMIAAIFLGYPYFSKGRASADLRQQELRNHLAKDYFMLNSLLADPLGSENKNASSEVLKKFFDIQQTTGLPYTGLLLLDRDRKVVSAYSIRADMHVSEMIGSSYAAIEFQGSEDSLHKVLTVYRTAKDHPMGKKGIEIAFELNKDNVFMGWLVFQMDMDWLSKTDGIDEKSLKNLRFDKP
jgi:PAS domain S-box-containing protein